MNIRRKFSSAVIAMAAACFAGGAFSQTSPPPAAPPATTPAQLEQLVAPIALYPDPLVAQILAASTYTDQVVDANRYLKSNAELKGKDLATAVNVQDWDPSIKALTQFPAVLGNMASNLAWTTSLGEAYANDPSGVMKAVQELRKQAKKAGTLKTTKEQVVTTQGSTIVIQPANPQVVYVPYYNPTVVYGAPLVVISRLRLPSAAISRYHGCRFRAARPSRGGGGSNLGMGLLGLQLAYQHGRV